MIVPISCKEPVLVENEVSAEAKQEEMLKMMSLASTLLEKVAQSEPARQELVDAALERIYGSQDVLFRDLFESAPKGARASQLRTSNFRSAWSTAKAELAADSKARGAFGSELKVLEKWLADNHIVAWMPMFSILKQFNIPINDITITYHPLIQDSVSTGVRINLADGKRSTVSKVNKRYVDDHPTWVIMPAEKYEGKYTVEQPKSANGRKRLDDLTPVGSPLSPSIYKNCQTIDNNWIVQTKFFQYRLITDWDPELFGGDSEVTILRASADGGVINTANGFLPGGATYVIWENVTVPYDDIQRMRWGDLWYSNQYTTDLDDNWKTVEAEQKILILDDDTGSLKFSGEVGAGWSGTTVSATAKINVTYDDVRAHNNGNIKFYNPIDRCSYFATANKDGGNGLTQPESQQVRIVNVFNFRLTFPYTAGTRSPGWRINQVDGSYYYFPMKFIQLP
ncbi:hypothetical protein [Fibrella aquatilis]|uniref:Uncharacterized protein n=1 Tax=Fibrella aquatilis TaxID=2817059 RepID=A0A939JUQ8_9BACT|nr:hypothetical protein [Fibrella aquatilis]MBO0930037.1 hypothetical protein [Fibrella aquatilis]